MKKIIVALLLFGITQGAHAILIDHDSYTTDTETRLDWLDLTITDGLPLLWAIALVDNMEQGWRMALPSEVETLAEVNMQNGELGHIVSLLGATHTTLEFSLAGGMVAQNNPDLINNVRVISLMEVFDMPDYVHNTWTPIAGTREFFGTYFVRPTEISVPEPASLSLLVLGLVSGFFLRRRGF